MQMRCNGMLYTFGWCSWDAVALLLLSSSLVRADVVLFWYSIDRSFLFCSTFSDISESRWKRNVWRWLGILQCSQCEVDFENLCVFWAESGRICLERVAQWTIFNFWRAVQNKLVRIAWNGRAKVSDEIQEEMKDIAEWNRVELMLVLWKSECELDFKLERWVAVVIMDSFK